MDIKAIRARIDAVDEQMAALFEERLGLVYQVAEYKYETGGKIFDAAREDEVVAKNCARIVNPDYREAYTTFIHMVMDQSKNVQKQYIEAQK